jgi:tRNA/rRNA methyltransferase
MSTSAPVIVLCHPQLGENIGAAARAMANFGLGELRLVKPRDGWPNERAVAASSGASHVMEAVRVFETAGEAVADLNFVFATTARDRDLTKAVRGPVAAAATMRQVVAGGGKVGLLFGREKSGLDNDEVALADEILTLPVDPRFSSLNIAQAVLVIAYEWRKGLSESEDEGLPFGTPERSPPASKELVLGFFEHLESALDDAGFFRPPEKRLSMVHNLRAIFSKGQLNEQEVRTLRGVVASLERRHERGRKALNPPSGPAKPV